jgi:hypothetical protein
LGGVDSPFYRQNLLSGSYPGFTPGLLHSSMGHTPFTPPNHMPTFTPKVKKVNLVLKLISYYILLITNIYFIFL